MFYCLFFWCVILSLKIYIDQAILYSQRKHRTVTAVAVFSSSVYITGKNLTDKLPARKIFLSFEVYNPLHERLRNRRNSIGYLLWTENIVHSQCVQSCLPIPEGAHYKNGHTRFALWYMGFRTSRKI